MLNTKIFNQDKRDEISPREQRARDAASERSREAVKGYEPSAERDAVLDSLSPLVGQTANQAVIEQREQGTGLTSEQIRLATHTLPEHAQQETAA